VLEQERKSLGVRHLLRKLRGTSPRPVSPEDQVQGLLSETSSIGTEAGKEEEPGALQGAAAGPGVGGKAGRSPLLAGLRGRVGSV